MSYKQTVNRLTYIEPNEYAGFIAKQNSNADSPNAKQLSWNQEDLAMFVDLQVIIPRREDAGHVSYTVRTDGTTISMDNDLYARYVSYTGGTVLDESQKNPSSYLTDNYTNISYQEISGNKAVDKESLGIDSIDINFDAHFFPLVTMHFTDVRGASLFMPSEEEFYKTVTNQNGTKIEDTPSSFFKALFHFPYPRFLLSVKGFYGTKVTFQLAVSDFNSDFQPETGNYGITVKFIGYVYGLYTDLPFNLIMAAPYYNPQYWAEQKANGIFKYVTSGGEAGNDIQTYIEFLSKMERKDVNDDALTDAELTQSYIKTKKALDAISKIPGLYKKLCESEPVRTDNRLYYTKRSSSDKTFIWGAYQSYDSNNQGWKFDEEIAGELYDAIRDTFKEYPECIRVIDNGNVFLDSFKSKTVNNRKLTNDDIIKDSEGKYKSLFGYLSGEGVKKLIKYFNFYNEGDTETGTTIPATGYYTIKEYLSDFTDYADTELKSKPILQVNGDLAQQGITGDELYELRGDTDRVKGRGMIIDVTGYCSNVQAKIDNINKTLNSLEQKVSEELKTAYANIIGFEPTVENYYRMLFAHIDCFFNYYTGTVLKKVKDDYNGNKRRLNDLGITAQDTDIPKRIASTLKENASVYAYPAYYTKNGKNQIKVADYPGYATGKEFSKIPEVEAVEKIMKGLKDLRLDYESRAASQSTISTQNIFSPLSVLYNFRNPWESIKLSRTNDEADVIHIIYYYICLLYADKIIGVNTNRQATDDVESYKGKMATMLWDVIGEDITDTFGDSLRTITNAIKQSDGLKWLDGRFKGKYRLYGNSSDSVLSQVYSGKKLYTGVGGRVALKVTDDILTTPISDSKFNVEVDSEHRTWDEYSDPDKNKNFVMNTAVKSHSMTNLRIQAFSDEAFLSGVDETFLTDFNNTLVKIGESRDYLSEKKSGDDVKPFLGEFYTTLMLDEPYKTDGTNPFVVFNTEGIVVFGTEKTTAVQGSGNIMAQTNINMTYASDYVSLSKHELDIYETLSSFYNKTDTNRHINFVGRKINGKTSVSKGGANPTALTSLKDSKPAVNLFSGVKKIVTGGTEVMTYKLVDNKSTLDINEKVNLPSGDSEYISEFKGLLYDKRCCPWVFDKQVPVPENSEQLSRYAFATYFLATLCGCDCLRNIVNDFMDNLKGNNTSYAIRKVELLYLGGSLYFAYAFKNIWSDNDKGFNVKDLILNDGTLGHGLLKGDDETDEGKKLIPINVYTLFSEGIGFKLMDYFTEWCNTELFGDNGMYDKLARVPNEEDDDYDQYITLNGFTALNDKIDPGNYALVQGYKTGSDCEKWLTKLAYDYVFAMTFYCLGDSSKNEISQSDITEFLEELYKPIAEKEKQKEETRKKLEEGDTTFISQDQKRGMYYLLKNLYDKWLCTYTANEFKLNKPQQDLELRRYRYTGVKEENKEEHDKIRSEYNNFIYIDQFYRDISSSFVMDSDLMAKTIKNVYIGRENMDIYSFMAYMAEKNNLMLIALPVYTNMYNASNVEQVFKPNTLYNMNDGDNCNGVGTTYVIMYTSDVSHKPSDFKEYDYDTDYVDIADLANNTGAEPLEMFNNPTGNNGDNLDYHVTAFAVSYGKQNQMYFKKVNVNMDNPKTTNETIQNIFMLADGGSQGDTNQPIAIGQNIYSIYSNRSYTCTVEMMGCMNIMPMMYFQLNNIPMFRGLYMIINVKHNIKAGNIVTTFTGVRVSKYSLPDISDVMLNSSIFNNLTVNSNAWKKGKAIEACKDCEPMIGDRQLTKDFTLHMMIKTSKGKCNNTTETNNNPTESEISNLKELCVNILQPLLDDWKAKTGGSFKVTSGFRSECINSLVGGTETSDHRRGCAADLQATSGGTQSEFKQFVKCWLWNNGTPRPFKQFIDETDGTTQWVHIAYMNGRNDERKMTLYRNRKYTSLGSISADNVGQCS